MKYSAAIFTLILFLMVSCEQNTNNPIDPSPSTSMNDLVIDDQFDWSTTQEVSIDIQLPTTVNYSTVNKRVDIFTSHPNDEGKLIHSCTADEKGHASSVFRIPAYYDSVYIASFAGGRYATIATNEKSGGSIVVSYDDQYQFDPPGEAEEKGLKSSYLNSKTYKPIHKSGKVANLVTNGTFEDNNFGTMSNWSSPMNVDGKWHFTNNLPGHISWQEESGNHFLRVDGNYFVYGGVAQLITASAGDEITFSTDYRATNACCSYFNRIWVYLIPRNGNGNSIVYYSVYDYGPENDWDNLTVSATMPAGTETCQVLYWIWAYRPDFILDIDNAVVTGPVNDSDGDGVEDDEDDYPDDEERAFDVYYPGQDEFGSLAFEDNWPGQGDYDFNDLVVDYNYKQVLNSENKLVDLDAKFLVRAIGASFENGFGFSLGNHPEAISSVTGINVPEDVVVLDNNNVESSTNEANIIVFENAFDILPHPGSGIGVNTETTSPYVEPQMLTVEVRTNTPIDLAETDLAPFNPFLIVDQERGREVHLPDHEPTSKADGSYFGTEDDNSDSNAGRFYKTPGNLPWAIDVPAPFAYPIEKIEIIDAYNYFDDWAESSGAVYDDWYLDLPGYRNTENIYPNVE
jgi:LruC domain-containing protein